MDIDAILERKPQVVLIDELAHSNISGSRNTKRYEDVFLFLDANIDVLSTINVQHIESLTPRIQSLTGIPVRETVPDWVLDRADEIVISDLTPEALVTRMRRGDIYPVDRAERALSNFFRRGNLMRSERWRCTASLAPSIAPWTTTSSASSSDRTGPSPKR